MMKFGKKRLRHELKYYIRFQDYEALRARLPMIMTLDTYSVDEEGYHIRSLYFDDAYDSSLHEKNYGVFKRRKYRIRIYNLQDRVIKLERKSKYDSYISKEASSLSRDEYDKILLGDVDFLLEREDELLRDFYFDIKNHLFRPRVITDYVREAYVMDLGNARVTFDKRLKTNVNSIDIFDETLMTVHAIHQPMMVMEVKYDHFLPKNVSVLLQHMSNQRSAISKYVICREESKKYYNL
ncbi:MAG: polyphosphate polymerase domain-containing protein [Clostridia bacterium]